uniref:Uncharacterized protein n=1 Tax=viral metagenome TaxID=1070528 RepID=A0A6M3J1U6_9ZZZZ
MQIPVSKEDYLKLSKAIDEHSEKLMSLKGEEYSLDNDFLAMENMLAGMVNGEPEKVSLVLAGKHITSLAVILKKCKAEDINLAKLDERVRDGCNLLKIMAAFIHAKQKDFSLHLSEIK